MVFGRAHAALMPGRCMFGSPFWCLLATDRPPNAASTARYATRAR